MSISNVRPPSRGHFADRPPETAMPYLLAIAIVCGLAAIAAPFVFGAIGGGRREP